MSSAQDPISVAISQVQDVIHILSECTDQDVALDLAYQLLYELQESQE